MAEAMNEGVKREIMFLVVTDKREGTTAATERVHAADYSRRDSYRRGVRRALRRMRGQYPKEHYHIQMYLAHSTHPLAYWG